MPDAHFKGHAGAGGGALEYQGDDTALQWLVLVLHALVLAVALGLADLCRRQDVVEGGGVKLVEIEKMLWHDVFIYCQIAGVMARQA